jgi:Uma2 family endonuclease
MQGDQMPQHRRYTLEEYIRLESDSDDRHEFRDGEIVSMAGGSLEHSCITTNVIRQLATALRVRRAGSLTATSASRWRR